MLEALLHPLNIFIIGLGGAFLFPLISLFGQTWLTASFVAALTFMTAIAGFSFFQTTSGGAPIEVLTGGAVPPYSINLRFGAIESFFCLAVNLAALLGAVYVIHKSYAVLVLYLVLVMGIQGMIATRDLFNLFVFLEIVSVATYGLLGMRNTPAALAATFRYIMATVIASTFFLVGTALVYSSTGLLNIDDIVASKSALDTSIGFAALMFVLAALLIELKPFPANGWALDVYQTTTGSVAAIISVGVSAGVFFALLKLLPLFEDRLVIIAIAGAITFLMSNLIGLRQTNVNRLLGLSSIGQMGLLTLALAVLNTIGADDAIPFVVGGLFINHLFAKAGLFWLAGQIGRQHIGSWRQIAAQPVVTVSFACLLAAICGLPPFPGFWAKWHLVLALAKGDQLIWIGVVLGGSLLEAAYLFRWFGIVVQDSRAHSGLQPFSANWLPIHGAVLSLVVCGLVAAGQLAGASSLWIFLPLCAGFILFLLEGQDSQTKALIAIGSTLAGGTWLIKDVSGMNALFAVLFLLGGVVISIACLQRRDDRPGFYPALAVLLLSLPALPATSTRLEFFFIWELITLSTYFLILQGRHAATEPLRFLLFSLVSAYFILAGFSLEYAVSGNTSLQSLGGAGPESNVAFALLAIGFLIKAGAAGVHVWLPGAYAKADDEVSALLSAVVSKAAMFGLLGCTYLAVRSTVNLDMAQTLAWIGMLTTLIGALMAVREDDLKRLLAYSSMSQIGYIVTAIAMLSHLGWVTALYLVANHLLVKGILFLAAAVVIGHTGLRSIPDLGGLAKSMPWTFGVSAVAVIAMSGLPPLTGFGGKWLLLSAMMEKDWYGLAIVTLLATFVGFIYMGRFLYGVFLGPGASSPRVRYETPLAVFVPQCLLLAAILLISFFPKILMDPISEAIDPYFASTLVWEGMSLKMIYGYWNPIPTMLFSLLVSAVLFGATWYLRDGGLAWSHAPDGPATGLPPASGQASLAVALTPPVAQKFWNGVATSTMRLAGHARIAYAGQGNSNALLLLYYVIALYALAAVWQ